MRHHNITYKYHPEDGFTTATKKSGTLKVSILSYICINISPEYFAFIYIYIYIYMYIYILSSTDRLSLCITTLQCDLTHEVLQTRIEIRLTLRQSHHRSLHCEEIIYIVLHIRYRILGGFSS